MDLAHQAMEDQAIGDAIRGLLGVAATDDLPETAAVDQDCYMISEPLSESELTQIQALATVKVEAEVDRETFGEVFGHCPEEPPANIKKRALSSLMYTSRYRHL